MSFLRVLFVAAVVLMTTSACSLRHVIAEDYPQYLSNNTGTVLPKTDKASEYALTANTKQHSYEFRAVSTGYANVWVVEFGKMLEDTLKSADVQKAFGALTPATDVSGNPNDVLVFDLQRYTFEEFGAQIVLKVSLMRGNREVFSNTYYRNGKTQGGKMMWGGAFAQRNAVQQSTKLALDDILKQLISELNTQVK